MHSQESFQPVYQNAARHPSEATRAVVAVGHPASTGAAARSAALRSPGVRALALAVLLLVLLAIATRLILAFEYRAEVAQILADAQRTAQKLASRTTEVLDQVDQTTLLVKVLYERGQLPPLVSLRQSGLLASDLTRAVMLVDHNGVVGDSTATAFAISLADDDDFKHHRRNPDLDVSVGASAVDHLGGGRMLPVWRRLGAAGESFGGMVMAVIDPAALTTGFANTEAPETVFGVLGLDGVFRSRVVRGTMTFGMPSDVDTVFANEAAARRTSEPTVSPIDGVMRFVATAPVARRPMLALVAVDADTALAGYRRERAHVLGWVAALALCIAGAAAALASQARQIEAGRERTRRAEAAFRATLEGSLDAVTILRAERSADGTLADMVVVDCNARAAQLVASTRDAVLGERLCTLAPSVRSGGFLAAFEHAIATQRIADGEIQADEAQLAGRWLHHRVVPVADGVALISRDVTDRKTAEARLASLARVDTLTQLPNRRHFDECLREALLRTERSGATLALLFIDLDGFKQINDSLGHAVGDRLLFKVGGRLRASVRNCDMVFRLGGDEFTVILEGAGTRRQVQELCGRVVRALSEPHPISGAEIVATPSIGAALALPGEAPADFCTRADAAMYAAKRAGKARFCLAADQTAQPDMLDAMLPAC